ncbi:MAG: ERCC4 domain-containing protein, partial [Armatimonadota bacterium]|nr:ERCC4 domain-containing protein [Armatimonadota bacterium]
MDILAQQRPGTMPAAGSYNLPMDGTSTVWVLETTGQERFPYRLSIRRGERTLLALRVQDRWPGGSGNVFCLRERDDSWPDPIEEIERVAVISIGRLGKRVSIVLDRPRRRRCELLFLKKPYRNREGEFEQIFWQTEKGLRERRPRARFVAARASPVLDVAVSSNEKFAWKFPGCRVVRMSLPVGDYALLVDGLPAAVVERKTFANLVRDLSDLRAIHHTLAELATCPAAAIVVEATYADFLRPEKVRPLTAAYTSRALAEIAALHPGVQTVFAGNRKLAVAWTRAFFLAVATQRRDEPLPVVREALVEYGAASPQPATEFRIRRA